MRIQAARFAIAAFAMITFVGCATPMPTLEFAPTDVTPARTKVDADLRSITVSVAREDEKLGLTQVGLGGNVYEQGFKAAFKESLEEGLARSAVFNDLSNRKVSLSAKVLKFQSPTGGINFLTEMITRYELIDRATGKIVFDQEVSSSGKVPGNYAFLGAARFTEARNRAVRENVKALVAALESIPLDENAAERAAELRINRPKNAPKRAAPSAGRRY